MIILPRRRFTQPQGAAFVDAWARPSTVIQRGAAWFAYSGGSNFAHSDGQLYGFSGTTSSETVSDDGVAGRSNNGNVGVIQPIASGQDVTLVFKGWCEASAPDFIVVSTWNGASFYPFAIRISPTGVKGEVFLTSVTQVLAHDCDMTVPRTVVFAARNGDQRLYVDGCLVVATSYTGSPSSQTRLRIASAGHAIQYAYMLRRSLSHDEAVFLGSNPWSLFAAEPSRLQKLSATPAGPALRYWDGDAWRDGVLRYWDGVQWQAARLRVRAAAAWM